MSLTTEKFIEIYKAHQMWLKERPGSKRANLSFESVAGLKLAGLNFTKAKLSSVDFSNCNLSGANFAEADCFGADFSHADLTNANFTKCDLRGAQFFKADLTDANLTKVDLRHGEVLLASEEGMGTSDKIRDATRQRHMRMVAADLSEAAMVNATVSQSGRPDRCKAS